LRTSVGFVLLVTTTRCHTLAMQSQEAVAGSQ
jgi:hypothetical protein